MARSSRPIRTLFSGSSAHSLWKATNTVSSAPRPVTATPLDLATGEWSFYYYPLEIPTSPNGGWVGLSEITHLGDDRFAVIERDNQGGPDATIKRIYEFSIAGLTPTADPAPGITPDFPVVEKRLVRDLMADLQQRGGLVLEKIEGLAVTPRGTALVVNDNDGVDDSNGETQLIRIKGLF